MRRVLGGLRSLLGAPDIGGAEGNHAMTLPSAAIYVYWDFASPAETMEWDLTVYDDPGASVGQYLALFNGSIDGSMCYLGLQTDVFNPSRGGGIGKGLIFSTWWSFDAADTRLGDGGFRELGTHEGGFVGVRQPYGWSAGDYRITLDRSESEAVRGRVLDWFDLFIEPLGPAASGGERPAPIGQRAWMGGLRFPRRDPAHPARIEPGGLMFLEVYSAARTWADVTPWRVDAMAYGDGTCCRGGRIEYPRPYGQHVPKACGRYNGSRARVELSLGIEADDECPPGRWP